MDMSPEWYWPIGADVLAELDPTSLYSCVIYPWINRKKDVSIWPVPLHDVDGRDNDWWASMREVMSHHAAQGDWVRIRGGSQAYDLEVAENQCLPPPEWPKVDLNTILRILLPARAASDRPARSLSDPGEHARARLMLLPPYRGWVGWDFEYCLDADGRPVPVCASFLEMRSGQKVQLREGEFGKELAVRYRIGHALDQLSRQRRDRMPPNARLANP